MAESTYRIIFHNEGKTYEVYAREVHQSAMFGFIEIEQLLFDTRSTVVVDPSEETLKSEFQGVRRTYIPMHAIVRIDEVNKQGHGKIKDAVESDQKIAPFPVPTRGSPTSEN